MEEKILIWLNLIYKQINYSHCYLYPATISVILKRMKTKFFVSEQKWIFLGKSYIKTMDMTYLPMGKTAGLTAVPQRAIDALHKEGKPQKATAKEVSTV